jgi:hypothetical protein
MGRQRTKAIERVRTRLAKLQRRVANGRLKVAERIGHFAPTQASAGYPTACSGGSSSGLLVRTSRLVLMKGIDHPRAKVIDPTVR